MKSQKWYLKKLGKNLNAGFNFDFRTENLSTKTFRYRNRLFSALIHIILNRTLIYIYIFRLISQYFYGLWTRNGKTIILKIIKYQSPQSVLQTKTF